MNGLLSIIGMKTELEYQMNDFPFGLPRIRFNVPKGNIPSGRQKCQPKAQHAFTIKGVKIMAAYKVEVDLSELFDDMTINEQKNFLVDKFCSLPIDKMVEVVGEMLENLNGDQTAKVIEDAFDNLHEQAQEHVINYVKG